MEDNVLEKVYKAALKFLVPLTLEETYELIVKEALKLIKGDIGSILIEQDGEFKRVYASNPILYRVKPRKKGFMYRVFKKHRALILTEGEIVSIHPQIKDAKVHSDILIPLYYKDKSLGILSVMSGKNKHFTDEELSLMNLFGPLATLAIRKTQLHDETKKALQTRDLFLSMAAHELRTPLTSVNGYVQLLHSKLSGTDKIESRWIEQLSWELFRLTELVKELLEVNRIKSGELQYIFKENSLREIVKRSLNNFSSTYPEREITFEDQLDGKNDLFIGDFDKILQAISNLIDNAIKFSHPPTLIKLLLRGNSKQLVLQIRDAGIGLDKKELPKILEGYYRAKDHSREGMGLGLYLVNNIVRRHHGALKFKSKAGKGTTVELILPTIKYDNKPRRI